MRKNAILLTSLFMLLTQLTQAAHIIGGEINYRCFGQGNYQITIKIYRDCYGGGAGFDSNSIQDAIGQVTIYQGNTPVPFGSIILDKPKVVNIEPDLSSECRDTPPDLCVEEGVYTFGINLPLSTESYYISYQRCCRNNTINNIHDPGDTGATYMVEISAEAQTSCNNSPSFKDFPPVAICANEALDFDHSAIDLEGDSLVYEFCSPLKGGSVDDLAPEPDANAPYENVDFVMPSYTMQTPLAGNPVVSIDPVTGRITGTPSTVGQFVVGICVKEYRDGQLLSVIQRDFQFNVVNCNFQVVADLDGATKEGQFFYYEICEDDTLRIQNRSYHQENIQAYAWQFELPDSILNSTRPHLELPFPKSGNYKGNMVVNPGSSCSDTALVSITVHPNPGVDLTYSYDSCTSGPVQFHLFFPLNGHEIEQYHWDFGDGEESFEILPTHQYATGGIYEVALNIVDQKGCRGYDYEEVEWTAEPAVPFEDPLPAEGCAPLNVEFRQLENIIDNTYEVHWEFGDGTESDQIATNHQYEDPGVYDLELSVISASGCELTTTYPAWVVVEAPPVAAFSLSPEDGINKNDELRFQNLSERSINWNWNLGGMASSSEENPVFAFPEPGRFPIELWVEDRFGCQDSTSQFIDVGAVYNIYVPNAFSPNEDDINDKFRAYVYCPLEQFRMSIFDRWGQQVFESEDVNEAWDGWKGSESFEPGVYAWVISYFADGRRRILKGDVTLVK